MRQLRRALRLRLAASIPEGSGAEIKNLCEALLILEGRQKLGEDLAGAAGVTVTFKGDTDDYSL